MPIEAIKTESLGDTSYVLAHGGYGLVVDPQRDIRRFLQVIERLEVDITHALPHSLRGRWAGAAAPQSGITAIQEPA